MEGNILGHEYDVEADGHKLAEVSKEEETLRLRDTYGIQVAPEADTLLVLAVAIALDIMTHPE